MDTYKQSLEKKNREHGESHNALLEEIRELKKGKEELQGQVEELERQVAKIVLLEKNLEDTQKQTVTLEELVAMKEEHIDKY